MLHPDILANIEFYPTNQGGRRMPTPPSFFGCIFVINNSYYDGRLLLENIGSIIPGDKRKNIPIKFLSSDLVLPQLKEGSHFHIKDGGIIGEGIVVSVLK